MESLCTAEGASGSTMSTCVLGPLVRTCSLSGVLSMRRSRARYRFGLRDGAHDHITHLKRQLSLSYAHWDRPSFQSSLKGKGFLGPAPIKSEGMLKAPRKFPRGGKPNAQRSRWLQSATKDMEFEHRLTRSQSSEKTKVWKFDATSLFKHVPKSLVSRTKATEFQKNRMGQIYRFNMDGDATRLTMEWWKIWHAQLGNRFFELSSVVSFLDSCCRGTSKFTLSSSTTRHRTTATRRRSNAAPKRIRRRRRR